MCCNVPIKFLVHDVVYIFNCVVVNNGLTLNLYIYKMFHVACIPRYIVYQVQLN